MDLRLHVRRIIQQADVQSVHKIAVGTIVKCSSIILAQINSKFTLRNRESLFSAKKVGCSAAHR